jgi:predicted outer membrane repeat protein
MTGGGMQLSQSHGVRIESCEFVNNRASDGPGGGLCQVYASATLTDCLFQGNQAVNGGAIYSYEMSTLTVENCEFAGNRAVGRGGAIWHGSCTDAPTRAAPVPSALTVRKTIMTGNFARHGGGAVNLYYISAHLEDCLIAGNSTEADGGGVNSGSSDLGIYRSTISGNFAQNGGGVVSEYWGWIMGSAHVAECAVWGNCASESGDEAFSWIVGISFRCCVVDSSRTSGQIGFLDGNVFTDPLFCDADRCTTGPVVGASYTVAANSPCLPAHNPCGVRIGLFGEGCGAVSIESTSWARIKARYR